MFAVISCFDFESNNIASMQLNSVERNEYLAACFFCLFFIMIRIMQLKLYRKAKCFLNVYHYIFCFVMFCTDFNYFCLDMYAG